MPHMDPNLGDDTDEMSDEIVTGLPRFHVPGVHELRNRKPVFSGLWNWNILPTAAPTGSSS